MGIGIGTGHVVIGMVAGDHHHGHEDDVLDALGFQLGNDCIQMGPAFDGVDADIAQVSCIEAVLDDGVISIGRMRRAMGHDQDGVFLADFRELCRKGFDEFSDVVALVFLPHPIHERRAEGQFLEIMFVEVENSRIIGIFHTRDDVQGSNGHARIAFFFQLAHGLFRRRYGHAFFSLDAVDDDMRREGDDDFLVRMGRLDSRYSLVDGLLAAVLIGRAEAQYQDGVFIGFVLHVRVVVRADPDFRGLFQSRRSVLDFRVQRIAGSKRGCRKSTKRRQGQR